MTTRRRPTSLQVVSIVFAVVLIGTITTLTALGVASASRSSRPQPATTTAPAPAPIVTTFGP